MDTANEFAIELNWRHIRGPVPRKGENLKQMRNSGPATTPADGARNLATHI